MTGEKSTHIGGSDDLVKGFRQWIASLMRTLNALNPKCCILQKR
jgi:hypothetical protein